METRQRRSFTDDDKRQAVDLVASSGRSIGSVAKELGLRDSVLRRSVEQRGVGREPTAASRRPTTWTKIGSVYANPARKQTPFIFLWPVIGARSQDESEDIETTFMTTTEIKRVIGQGQFSQTAHAASFYMSVEGLMRDPIHSAS